MTNSDNLRPGLVRDEIEHCATCGADRAAHDAKPWPHVWLPRLYVREVAEPSEPGYEETMRYFDATEPSDLRRSTHRVYRVTQGEYDDSPCFCDARADHIIGKEQTHEPTEQGPGQ